MPLIALPSADTKDQLLWSDSADQVDLVTLLPLLNATYFGATRTRSQILKQIENSIPFSLYVRNRSTPEFVRQVGFARVVTDRVSFGWLCDVVIDPVYRRRGFGTKLMRLILAHPALESVTINLGTRDSHAFYAQFGFEECKQMMRRSK